MKASDRIAFSAQRLGWEKVAVGNVTERYQRDGYTIDITYTNAGAITGATLFSPSWMSLRAGRRERPAERVMSWMVNPTEFIKPPAERTTS